MLDPAAVATGVITGIAANEATRETNKVIHPGERSPQDDIIDLLKDIRDGVRPAEKDALNETFQLMPYPSEYIISDDLKNRSHICIFFFAATPIRFDGVFGGTYTANVGPGWKILDMPGRLSVNGGAANFTVTVSYRNDTLGSSF